MTTKYAVACFVLGLAAILAGALLKTMHWAGADWLQLAGMALGLVGVLLVLLRFFRSPKARGSRQP